MSAICASRALHVPRHDWISKVFFDTFKMFVIPQVVQGALYGLALIGILFGVEELSNLCDVKNK